MNNSIHFQKWESEQFVKQMESWLDFTWANLKNPKYNNYQGVRQTRLGSPIGKTTSPKRMFRPIGNEQNVNHKSGLKTAFNSWELFQDWKAQPKEAHKCFLSYDQAVNEMNIFLDFMQDNYLDFVEY